MPSHQYNLDETFIFILLNVSETVPIKQQTYLLTNLVVYQKEANQETETTW